MTRRCWSYQCMGLRWAEDSVGRGRLSSSQNSTHRSRCTSYLVRRRLTSVCLLTVAMGGWIRLTAVVSRVSGTGVSVRRGAPTSGVARGGGVRRRERVCHTTGYLRNDESHRAEGRQGRGLLGNDVHQGRGGGVRVKQIALQRGGAVRVGEVDGVSGDSRAQKRIMRAEKLSIRVLVRFVGLCPGLVERNHVGVFPSDPALR